MFCSRQKAASGSESLRCSIKPSNSVTGCRLDFAKAGVPRSSLTGWRGAKLVRDGELKRLEIVIGKAINRQLRLPHCIVNAYEHRPIPVAGRRMKGRMEGPVGVNNAGSMNILAC